MEALKGYKTYIIAILMALVAITQLFAGDISITQFVNDPYFILLLEAAGIATLRHGIG